MTTIEQTPTLILSPRFSIDSNKLWKAAIDVGWNIHRAIRYQPPATPGPYCVYGERKFCDSMAYRLNLALLDPPDNFLGNLPKRFVNRDIYNTSVYDLKIMDWRTRRFVKSACADKPFEAGIYESPRDVPVRWVAPWCPIIISEVVEFVAEVRLYILDNEIISANQYHLVIEKEPEDVEKEAMEFGYELLDYAQKYCKESTGGHLLPSAVVVDVGYIPDRGWAVVEANQAYSSGLYTEDPFLLKRILNLIMRAGGERGLVRPEDKTFIRSVNNQ